MENGELFYGRMEKETGHFEQNGGWKGLCSIYIRVLSSIRKGVLG